jgi:hypothetical protein
LAIDPEHDAVEVLLRHAEPQRAAATHWRFVTGELRDINVLGPRSGLEFWE